MSVESSISLNELKDQDLENWALQDHQELQRVTTGRKSPLIPTVRRGNNPREKEWVQATIRNRSRLFSGYHLTFSTGNYLTHIISFQVLT